MKKHKRWRKIFRLKGYLYNEKLTFWSDGNHTIFVSKKQSGKDKFFKLKLEEASECYWCGGTGIDAHGRMIGAYYDCPDCQGKGKDLSKC